MNVKLLFSSVSSACFELENSAPYYAPEKFKVLLNGEEQYECDHNVFSLYGLEPDTEYRLTVRGETFESEREFWTRAESCCIDVHAFGAVGDGIHDDTEAIRCAIGCLPENGRLLFPAGTYLTKPQFLKSHITLELCEGATLLGWTKREDYPIIPGTVDAVGGEEVHFGTWEGNAVPMYQALLTAQYAEDITIIGPGTVDGNAQNTDFWTSFHTFPTGRPRLLFLNRCKNVTVHGIHACNAASWQLHPYFSEKLSFYDLLISAPKHSPNTDALDPEACTDVNIIGCRFTVGDDCIAIKSGKFEIGQKFNRPAAFHTIRNCLMEFGHGAITLGSEIGAGVRDLTVSQCWFRGTDRGLRIKSRRGRGKNCRIDGVSFDNIRMEGVLTPIVINLWYNCCDPDRESEYVWSREHLPVDDRTPYMGSFRFSNLTCTDAEVAACYIDGLPEAPIDSVSLENVDISFSTDAKPGIPMMENFAKERCRLGLYLDNVRHISVDNVHLSGVDGDKLIANHYETLEQKNFSED